MNMTTSLNSASPAREAGYEMLQYICGRVTIVTAGTDVNTKIGTLPIGAVIVGIHSKVVTAVTVGTLQIGTASGGAQVTATIAETAGSEWLQPLSSLVQPLAADTAIWAGTTGSATAGDVIFTVCFAKPLA
jgi:hypothetical protein